MQNMQANEGKTKLQLVMPKRPSFVSPRAFVSPVEYDADLDVFYLSGMNARGVVLPANFHTHELMDLDPSDRSALLNFQRTWGLLTSPRREPLRVDTLGTPRDTMSTPLVDASDAEALELASDLHGKLKERHSGYRDAQIMQVMVGEGWNGAYLFAPGGEVEATVSYLQSTVKRLVEAHYSGFDSWAGIETRKLRSLIADVEAAIAPYYPHFRMASSETVEPVLPLTIATLAQTVGYISENEGYRECKWCHKLFMYKRKGDSSTVATGRDVRTLYCSEDCKQWASSAAQSARRKEARRKKKEVGDNGTH